MAERYRNIESEHQVENTNEALILLDDELQQIGNIMSIRTSRKENFQQVTFNSLVGSQSLTINKYSGKGSPLKT